LVGGAHPTAMSEITQAVTELVNQFARLPGIGKKSAERLTYHVLHLHKNEAMALADAIRNVKENVHYCKKCYNLAEGELCGICQEPGRQQETICVVEQPRDLMSLEQTGAYRGLYHVLLGRISPLEGVGPDQLTIDALVQRVRAGGVNEIIMATNPTVEGDGTALYISNLLAETPVKITRLARGITTGSVLEYANKEMLSDALTGRQTF
jgi:recombination protein RecR